MEDIFEIPLSGTRNHTKFHSPNGEGAAVGYNIECVAFHTMAFLHDKVILDQYHLNQLLLKHLELINT